MKNLLGIAIATSFLLPATAAWAVLDVDAGDDVTLECESEDGAEYTLNGSIPDEDGITSEWTTVPNVDLDDATSLTPTGVFPIGDTVATLTATTDLDSGEDSATVTVEDTTAPVVRARAKPYYLWPPNHEMHEITVKLRIRDACSDSDDYEVELISATSNEPDNSNGDGNTVDDIQGADIGSDDRNVLVRAERKGNGNGRVYTLSYRVTDAAGNETIADARVYVPHDASDLKDLLEEHGGDHGDLEPICPLPYEAAEEFVDALPSPGQFSSESNCLKGCRAWAGGCSGIIRGATACVSAEARSLMALEELTCQEYSSRSQARACKNALRGDSRNERSEARAVSNEANEVCRDEAEQCVLSCEGYFDAEEFFE